MTAPNADQQAVQIEQGVDPTSPTGFNQGWMSRLRARKVLGDNINKLPFVRSWGSVSVAASPMEQDKLTAIADAVGFRRVATETAPVVPPVVDVGDMIVIAWEYFKLTADPKILAQAVANAKAFPKWPTGYAGVAPFEVGT